MTRVLEIIEDFDPTTVLGTAYESVSNGSAICTAVSGWQEIATVKVPLMTLLGRREGMFG